MARDSARLSLEVYRLEVNGIARQSKRLALGNSNDPVPSIIERLEHVCVICARCSPRILFGNTKDYVDGRVAGYLCNEISPASRVRPATHFYALADCRDARRCGGPFDPKPHVEHVLRRGHQVNVNFEATIFDRSLHDDLRFRLTRKRTSAYFLSGQSGDFSPIAHSLGGSPSAVFWYNQLPQTVQFQLLLIIFVILPYEPNVMAPDAARSPSGGALDGFPTSARQASQGCMFVSKDLYRGIVALP